MSLASKILDIARAELGTCESPLGSNNGSAIRKYKAATWLDPDDGWPWCNAFVDWVWEKAVGKSVCRSAGCNYTYDWAKANGFLVSDPMPGDAAILDYDGDGDYDHITFVEKVNKTTITVVGGNQTNCVTRTNYDKSKVVSYVRLPDNTPPPPKRPKYEIVVNIRGDSKVVYTVGSVEAVLKKAKQTLKKYGKIVIRKK